MPISSSWVPSNHGAINGNKPRSLPAALVKAMALRPAAFSDENFLAAVDTAASTMGEGYTTINPGGYAVVVAEPPTDDDTVSRGEMRATVTPDPAGGKSGFRRSNLIGARNMFPSDATFWLAVRFMMLSAVPTAADDYGIRPAGVGNISAHPPMQVNGNLFLYDRTLGVAQYVLRSVRAGVAAVDIPLGLTFAQSAAAYHTLAYAIKGTTRIGYLDGVEVDGDTAAEVQPDSVAGSGYAVVVASLAQIAAALSFSPIMKVDRIVWGQA